MPVMRPPPAPRRRRAVVVLALALLAALLPALPAQAVCSPRGAIGDYWRSAGGAAGWLGGCTSDELPVAGGVVQRFAGGSVYWSGSTGAHGVRGGIGRLYEQLGGASSDLGLPVTSEIPTAGRTGAYTLFQRGSIVWGPGTGASVVRGAVRDRWLAAGGPAGVLGLPTASETAAAGGGAVGRFEGGALYWSAGTGARVVRGGIGAHWGALGAERGPLGYPIADEAPTPVKDGAQQPFQRGTVVWSPATGARAVQGAIRERWLQLGAEGSSLGFPVGDERAVPGGARSEFQGGALVWDATTGQVDVETGPEPAYAYAVSAVTAADLPSSWRSGCPVPPQDLRLLRLSHRGVDGAVRTGELVVAADVLVPVLRAFERLYAARFPVERMVRLDGYGGSDDASMDANNSSAFNCRRVAGGASWSEHAYGRAIDLNPVQNPYVSGSTVAPRAGRAYLDRADVRPGMVVADDVVVRAFAAQGWGWGGTWSSAKDYQHFSRSGR